MVPSSTTVTPFDATRWPIRPAKADVFLRLKSPSSPWPTASCSITPGQPGPSTTSISPAGAGTASRLTSACRTAWSTACFHLVSSRNGDKAFAAAIAVAAGFLAIAVARDHRNIDRAPAAARRDSSRRRRAGSPPPARTRRTRPRPAAPADPWRGHRRRSSPGASPWSRTTARRAGCRRHRGGHWCAPAAPHSCRNSRP